MITIYQRAVIFHKQIGLGDDMTPNNFVLTLSKVKVTVVNFLIM